MPIQTLAGLFDVLVEIVNDATEFGFGGDANTIVPQRNQHLGGKWSGPNIGVAEDF